jgi:hypothetical protein
VTWHQYPNFRALAFNGALTASTHLGGSRFRLTRIVRCIGTVGGESGGAADSAEGVEVLGVRVGEDMQDGDVLLRIQRPGLLLDDLGELGVGAGVER